MLESNEHKYVEYFVANYGTILQYMLNTIYYVNWLILHFVKIIQIRLYWTFCDIHTANKWSLRFVKLYNYKYMSKHKYKTQNYIFTSKYF